MVVFFFLGSGDDSGEGNDVTYSAAWEVVVTVVMVMSREEDYVVMAVMVIVMVKTTLAMRMVLGKVTKR